MDDMLDCTAFVVGSTMLTDVLDAPVAELTASEHINFCYHFFNCWSLFAVSTQFVVQA